MTRPNVTNMTRINSKYIFNLKITVKKKVAFAGSLAGLLWGEAWAQNRASV